MTFKLKADTIFIIRYALEEMYYLEKPQTVEATISRPTLFVLTKKFTNKQLQLYRHLPVIKEKKHKLNFEIHEAVLLREILIKVIQVIDNHYSAVFLNKFIDELRMVEYL